MREPTAPRSQKELASHIGSRIKALRLQRGWTQKDLAAILGQPVSNVTRYETGAALPRTFTLFLLSSAFGTGIGALVDEPESGGSSPDLHHLVNQLQALHPWYRDAILEFVGTAISAANLFK